MKKILIVSDSETLRLLYSLELADEGYKVYTSKCEAGALDEITRKKPHLIVVNLNPGKYEGPDFLLKLRRACRNTPVIFCMPCPGFALHGKSSLNEDFIVISSDVSELKQKVRRALETKSKSWQKAAPKNAREARYLILQTV